MSPASARREARLWLAVVVGLVVLSGVAPHERGTWLLEVLPVLIGLAVLVPLWPRHPLTPLTTRWLAVHAAILVLGAHYTYARVPLGEWAREVFGLARNHYDRLGHLAQGFVPALLAREVLLRATPLRPGGWLFLLTTCVCLAFSALYELIEWWTALLAEGGATAFLGTQGDPWDTQWDMFLCLCGAVLSQLLLGRRHEAAVARLVAELAPAATPESGAERGAA